MEIFNSKMEENIYVSVILEYVQHEILSGRGI